LPLAIFVVLELVIINAACAGAVKVTVTGAEVIAEYIPLAALVTVTEQVPDVVLLTIVPVPVVALVVAAVQPAVEVANANAPVPDPPVIERLIAVPAGPEVTAGTRVKVACGVSAAGVAPVDAPETAEAP
jgi:hypothetical protein